MNIYLFWKYLLIMAGVTYLIRVLPLVLFKRKITSTFVKSFLFYVPYAVLGAMTFPAIFFSTGNVYCASAGCAVACLLAFKEKSLLTVAIFACLTVLLAQSLFGMFIP